MKKKFKFQKRQALIALAAMVLFLGTITYAYFTSDVDNTKNQRADLSTAILALRFADGDNGINAKLNFGESVTKKFTIENTGTAEASLSLDWKNLINTYMNGSLTYRLTYSESQNGEYKEIIPETNMPVSSENLTQTMASELSVPTGETYYYNLEITLNSTEVEQTPDLDAVFNTSFDIGQPMKYRYYTLSVNPNGGEWNSFSNVQEYPLQNGDTKEISDPTRVGHTFAGWKLTGVSSKLEDNLFTMGIANASLEAEWDIDTYHLTIDANGGSYDGETSIDLDYGSTISIAEPTREGYTFTGWSASAGTIEGSSFTLNETSDVTLTANWTINSYNYTVVHRQMNVTGEGYTVVSADTVTTKAEYGSRVTPEVKEYEGFESPSAKTLTISVNEDANVITYDYKRNQYTLAVNPNGGSYSGSTSVTLYYGASTTIANPSKEGHTFTNWGVSSGTLSDTTYTMGASNATIVAEYTVNNYKYIVYHKQMNVDGNGYTTVDADTDQGTAAFGSTVNPATKSYTGFTSPTRGSLQIKVDNNNPPTLNVLNYQYSRNKYNLTIDLNGGTYTGDTTVSMYYGGKHTLGTPTRTGYIFDGWSKTTNNDSTLSDSTFTMGSSATTVTANWTVNKYTYKVYHRQMNVNGSGYTIVSADTVTSTADYGSTITPTVKTYTGFSSPSAKSIVISDDTSKNEITYDYARNQYALTINPNGGSYNSSTSSTSVNVYYGATYTLGTPTRTGYTHSWSKTSGAGSLSGSTYTMGAGVATVTANWTARTFSVTFNANGGTTPTASTTVTYASTYGTLPEPTYSGYKFLGWFTASSGGTQVLSTTTVDITANQTLWARWEEGIPKKIAKLSKGKLSDFSNIAPGFSSYTDDNFNKSASHNSQDTTKQNNYYTYASTYSFDSNTGKYTLINPQICKYSTCYNTLKNKYITSRTGSTSSSLESSSNISTIYKVTDSTTLDEIYYISSSKTKNYTDFSNDGIYEMADDYGTSYYFRGAVENNYVKFGKLNQDVYQGYLNSSKIQSKLYSTLEECNTATKYNIDCNKIASKGSDMWWRIIRVNGDGSLRIIYDGTQAYKNGESNLNRLAFSTEYNDKIDDAKYIGYMYSPAADTASTSYAQATTNTVNSIIKTKLDKWYQTNIEETGYSKYIGDEIFCNDRSIPGKSATEWNDDTELGYGANKTGYGAASRFLTGNNTSTLNAKQNPTPQFLCPNKNDSFTVSNTTKGNGALTYPIGLITADEIVAAGSGKVKLQNYNYYLYKSTWYWSMTPSRNISIFTTWNAEIASLNNNNYGEVAPVINLSPKTSATLKGSGTMTDPYTVS